MSKNQQPFHNKEIERLRISPLLSGQSSVHYLLVRTNVGRKSGGDDPAKITLLVDTGASHTTLPENTLNRLGYDTKNPVKWHPGLIIPNPVVKTRLSGQMSFPRRRESTSVLGNDHSQYMRTGFGITGKGQTERIPIIQISSFFCLKKEIVDFPVLAYTLPRPTYWDGVLGMDFLTHFRAVILLENANTGQADQIVLR